MIILSSATLVLLLLLLVGWVYAFVRIIRAKARLEETNTEMEKQLTKLLSQKKSSEILLGLTVEKLIPFLEVFKHDPRRAVFIGNPIDYIVFEDNQIVFVEIKSGHSSLTSKQRKIRNLVTNKQVSWETIRLKPDKNNATKSSN